MFLTSLIDFLFPPRDRSRRARLIAERESPLKKAHDVAPHDIQALLSYKDPHVRTLIHAFKYEKSPDAVRVFTDLLFDELLEIVSERTVIGMNAKPFVTFIPARKDRVRSIGFAQGDLVLKELRMRDTEEMCEYIPNLLYHRRTVLPQTSLKKRERVKNMEGVFGASELAQGRSVVVIDDVTTTGSTLKDAERALTTAGARDIILIAIAH
jgi:ComF family protein